MDLDALGTLLEQVGDRWSLLLLASLRDRPRTFAEFQEVGGISPTVLSSRLSALETSGYVEAVAYQDRPARYRYGLTDRGQSLQPAIEVLAHVAGDRRLHDVCATVAEARWWCPTCDEPADGDGLIHL